ncbi:MAG TPA: hypothetical protein VMZ71_11810 [Gemmataceae bacterium]|nr:hypothetical protein [Gemmataceae bacterium]
MSQPLTFPCPFCGRRMGVGMELAGKHVRCPHCKQIVLAPTAAVPTTAPPAPPPPSPMDDGPVFNTAPRESADSILSDPEESEDEVFSSSKNGTRMRIPDLPEPGNPWGINDPVTRIDTRQTLPLPVPEPPPAPADANPFAFSPPPPPPPPPRAVAPPKPTPPVVPTNPWSGLDDMAANATAQAPPLPPASGPFAVTPVVPASVMEQPAAPPAPDPVPTPRARPQPAAATGGISTGVFFAVAGYALVATALAVYGLFIKSGDATPPGHPLSTIPDTFGEFDPAQRKKVSKLSFPVDGELPPEQRVALGKKLEIGQLVIEPLRVTSRPLRLIGEFATGGAPGELKTAPALVLTMRVRNTSDDVAIFPLDPAFNRKNVVNYPLPISGLVVGAKTFWGGEIEWPFAQRLKRMYEGNQADDAKPLKPKESREYVVFTAADGKAPAALRDHTGTATWRVQVRRGLVSFRGKDVPVTAIVGVEFQKSDVSGL